MAKTPRLQYASSTDAGLLSTGSQTISGAKTFSAAPVISDASGIVAATGSASGVLSTGTQTIGGDKTFSGTVYRTNQPIISGQMGTAMTNPAAPTKLAFNEFWVSRGITYNSGNQRFIVPVAGVYRITMNPFFQSGVGAGRICIGVNNEAPIQTTHYGHCYREAPTYDTCCISSVVSLNASDYIVFYLLSGAIYNQNIDKFNQFSIELIG
jgi:hypothetical protein